QNNTKMLATAQHCVIFSTDERWLFDIKSSCCEAFRRSSRKTSRLPSPARRKQGGTERRLALTLTLSPGEGTHRRRAGRNLSAVVLAKRWKCFSLSLGIQLLAIAQRTISVGRKHIST